MITLDKASLLVVAPHPDDEVIGCGGLISKVKSQGGQVAVLFMTVGDAQDFTNGGRVSTSRARQDEIKQVASHLQFDQWRIALPGDQYHLQLDQVPQKQLIHEIERGEEISLEVSRPTILAIPRLDDYNQDHRATALAAIAACRPAPAADKYTPPLIISYEMPMNAWTPAPLVSQANLVIALTPEQLQHKLDGMNLYRSQVRDAGHPRHVDSLAALAHLRGSLIGTAAGEAYYCHKLTVA